MTFTEDQRTVLAKTFASPVPAEVGDVVQGYDAAYVLHAYQRDVPALVAERDQWFDAYNELRDQGDPSWDTFDTAVNAAVKDHMVRLIERINDAIVAEWSAQWAGTERGDGLLRATVIATEIGETL